MIFLVDGLGASFSAVVLAMIGLFFDAIFGMPVTVLWGLSCVALIYSVYSFSCYFTIAHAGPRNLKFIAVANIFYCVLTGCLVAIHYREVTILGYIYFSAEIVVISALAVLEWRVSNANTKRNIDT